MYKNYKYYFGQNKVIAVSSYAGRPLRGVAKCAPEDQFDVVFGKELAAARCNVKVAERRYKRALKERMNAERELAHAMKRFDDMQQYVTDSGFALEVAKQEVSKLEK